MTRRLDDLRHRILAMAGRVEVMIDDSVRAMTEGDVSLARRTIAKDRFVDADEVAIDRLCLELLSSLPLQPSEMRFITIALKMVTDLERIGDLAVSVCEQAKALSDAELDAPYVDIPEMGRLVAASLRRVVDAFVERDIDEALAVIEADDTVDELYERVFADVMRMMEEGLDLQIGVRVQSVAKVLERMGDHATNLAEQVVFMVGGEDVRHGG